jgi:hypothetical protein
MQRGPCVTSRTPHPILSIDLIIYLLYSAGHVKLIRTYAVRFQYESTTNRISKIFRQVITPLSYFSVRHTRNSKDSRIDHCTLLCLLNAELRKMHTLT